MHTAILMGDDALCQCLLCQSEIPRETVLTVEAQDYAYYFCGQGCYLQWQWEQDSPDEPTG